MHNKVALSIQLNILMAVMFRSIIYYKMLLKLIKFQKLSPLTLFSRRYYRTVRPTVFWFSSDKQKPPQNGNIPKDQNQNVQQTQTTKMEKVPPNAPGEQSGVNGSKAEVPKIEEIFSKEQLIIFNMAKQSLEKDAEIKLIKTEKDMEKQSLEKDAEIKLIKTERDMEKQSLEKDAEIKLIKMEKLKAENEIEKLKVEKQKVVKNLKDFIRAVFGIIGLYMTYWTIDTYLKGIEVQKEGVRVQQTAAGIYTRQKVQELLKKYSTTPLNVPQYYVEIPQLVKEVSKNLTYLDQSRDQKERTKTFRILTGFPGYGKSTAFASEINKLRVIEDQIRQKRKQQKEKIRQKKQLERQKKEMEKNVTPQDNRLILQNKPQENVEEEKEEPYRKIYYFNLRCEEKNKTEHQIRLYQEQKAKELVILLKAVASMPPEWQKYITIVIDDINRLGKQMDNKETKYLEGVYFGKILGLSLCKVNMICISSSQWFSSMLEQVSQVEKQGLHQRLPVPTNAQRQLVIEKCLKCQAKGRKVHEYMQKYFKENYSSIRNITKIITTLKDSNKLFAESQSEWLKEVKKVEQALIQKKFQKMVDKLQKFCDENQKNKKACKTVIKCLLKDYNLQKSTKTRDIRQIYPQQLVPLSLDLIKVLRQLSKARVVNFNQISNEISKGALENFYKML